MSAISITMECRYRPKIAYVSHRCIEMTYKANKLNSFAYMGIDFIDDIRKIYEGIREIDELFV